MNYKLNIQFLLGYISIADGLYPSFYRVYKERYCHRELSGCLPVRL